MRRAPVLCPNRLVTKGDAPRISERHVWQCHLRLALLGGGPLVLLGPRVRDDLLRRRPQHAVAARVIGMVMTVDQHVDAARAALLEPAQQVRRRVGELAVHHEQAVTVEQPADGAATLMEDADVSPQRSEHRRRGRRGGRCAGRSWLLRTCRRRNRGSRDGQCRSLHEIATCPRHVIPSRNGLYGGARRLIPPLASPFHWRRHHDWPTL